MPKRSPVTCLNDYRPVALTSIVMKCLETLISNFIQSQLPPKLDPFQFAYKANRSVDDAVSWSLFRASQFLDKNVPNYCRILFVDYSSAFNTISPFKLYDKLITLNFNHSLCRWILDFLLDRSQKVRIGQCFSKSLVLSTGAPQGCILSPMLYSLFTHDCEVNSVNNFMVKYADDTTLGGLIFKDDSMYRDEVNHLVQWCHDNNLELNVQKTKEIIVDFRKNPDKVEPLNTNGSEVEIVDSFKFLGVHISNDLKWVTHVDSIVRKAQQRLFFLRRLRSFGVRQDLLVKFYRAVVESILTLSITVWYGNTTADDRKRLNRVVGTASFIIGRELPALDKLYAARVQKKSRSIISDEFHPANSLFELMRSGKRYRVIRADSNRTRNSFYPSAIRLLND